MLTIVLGLALTVILIFVIVYLELDSSISEIIILLFFTVSFIIGLFVPISGYSEWELVKETELISLSNTTASGSKGLVYVSLTADNAYTYRYEIDSKFGTESSKEYQTQTLVNKDVEEIEDSNCSVAVVREYCQKAKRTIWTFALGQKNSKYVFYVPEGTISKNIELK